ncbi:rho GTPase-activating protein 20-like isoform X2 [Agrilus planipennis]|uniref:Rho GTPase-activating protein 20-like isoform X2 n=1 Tax=Agrilus planipennis TaxID=224129 RepID=A0A1W4WWJ3_AGRPL|nr:rho GTPase-activating protein 20-like isoform X2 [Agrilus planipennis]
MTMCKTSSLCDNRRCEKGLKTKVERLTEYGRYLGGSQPSLDGRRRDLDRIQDLFPHDFLGLHEREPMSTYNVKSKLSRKKSLGDITSVSGNNGLSLSNRVFMVEAPCAVAPVHAPLQAKPRHLFLFSDLLLVAKPRSGGTFKLKESVRVSELWLAPYPESETGFLLGYPGPARTYIVNFCTQAARDSWWRELQQALAVQLRLEPPTTNIKVIYRDPRSGTECSKTLGVGPEMNTGDIARLALDDTRHNDSDFTLWTRERDSPPCPLLGCERPHSIQLARIRQSVSAEEGFDLAHCNNNRLPCDIVFELKPTCKTIPRNRTPLKLFRKNSARIFGVPLTRLVVNSTLHPVLSTILRGLFQRGPHTQGIFRRCASARALRELREKIDTQGAAICEELANSPPLLLGALLKDFLRSLPSPLLSGNVHEWLNATSSGNMEHIRRLLSQLPRENHVLLSNIICVLYQVAKRARYNLMSATNLGVCFGPSLLWESSQNAPMRTLPTLVELLINKCQVLFGAQVVSLLGEPASDSGAEESDSLHSLGLSLDSVELSKDQKSLSRDSGLTLSEDDRDSPGLNYNNVNNFHRSDWTRQPARIRALDSTWIEEDEAFCASNESLCMPPVPPRRPPPLRHLPPVHLPPIYRPPPPPPPTYATARLLLVTDSESESYV